MSLAGTGGLTPAGTGGLRLAGIGDSRPAAGVSGLRPAGIGSLRPAGIGGPRPKARWNRCSGVKPSGAGLRRYLMKPAGTGGLRKICCTRQGGAGADLSGTLRGYERSWPIVTPDVDFRLK